MEPSGFRTRGRHRAILVVEDEEYLRRLYLDALGEDHLIITASSGGEALRRLSGDPPAGLVILNHHLPDMSGFNVLEQIRSEKPELPVLMVSASTGDRIAAITLKKGASGFLRKPFRVCDLVAKVNALFQGSGV